MLVSRDKGQLPPKRVTSMAAKVMAAKVMAAKYEQGMTFESKVAFARSRGPAQSLNGDLELKVAAGANLKGIVRELGSNPHHASRIFRLNGLNHLFESAISGAHAEYRAIEITLAPEEIAETNN